MVTETEREAGSTGNASQPGGNSQRLGAIEQALSELHSSLVVPEKELQAIQANLPT
ncbi:hypothetical protein NXY50_00020 [Bacteroides thetaiotaomicron]|nr:hypothetical protein [Bacteroides thetaiotaomicron]MCS2259447.1 hypothetical protein [Bacteroides thetaiotaomicron]